MPESERPRCDVLDCEDDRQGRCYRRGGVCKMRVVFGGLPNTPSVTPDEDANDEVDIE